jgi:hypothetical protein
MTMRFRKSIRLAPGVRINLSRSGVSTTLGGRGASVNIGRKGTRATVGIPGTGLSFSQQLSNGGRAGGTAGTGGGGSNEGAARASGCASTGCLGFFLLVLIGMCTDSDSPPSSSYSPTPSTYSTSAYDTSSGAGSYGSSAYGDPRSSEAREWFYIHGPLNVRAQPDKSAARVRTLQRGDYVQLGSRDANGWAPLYSSGSVEGYVYRASDEVQRQAPRPYASSSVSSSSGGGARRRSSGGRTLHIGPRGGCYYYNGSGNKQYVDRSECH